MKYLIILSIAPLLICAAPGPTRAGYSESGIASMYDEPQEIACPPYGEFDPEGMTAAHKSLPCGSEVRVTNLSNGRQVVVKINDRGPYIQGRIIDLSRASFRAIASTGQGLVQVKIERIR